MAGPETRLANKIKKRLKREFPGIFLFKVHGGEFQEAGLPDFIGCYDGRFIGFEVKRPGEPHPLTDLQRMKLDQIDAADGIAAVVHSPDEAEEILTLALGGMWDWHKQGYHGHEPED